ncbi:hypothetical protein EYF80_044673 [Liparis tanakae]|uniref:Uncharacterized protein n=1 Tax=Liparis tanakae TaxID=230148 RepID=A0A4Z2FX79_9TELE|nr:hypothetical protein EYF80_044673 [Liparis tanakae]
MSLPERAWLHSIEAPPPSPDETTHRAESSGPGVGQSPQRGAGKFWSLNRVAAEPSPGGSDWIYTRSSDTAD